MFQNIGPIDWLIIAALVLIFFRADRITDIARTLGRSISEFKKGLKDGENDLKKHIEDKDAGDKKTPEK